MDGIEARRVPDAAAARAADVALVNVPYGAGDGAMRPIGLAYLGAYLERNGIRARGFDLSTSRDRASDLVRRWNLHRHPVVGLSFYNTNAALAYDLARAVKAANPRALVVAGGPHVSAVPESVLRRHRAIDAVVRNEGEEALLALLSSADHGQSEGGIAGCTLRVGDAILSGLDRERIGDLDALPAPVFAFESDVPPKPLAFYDRDQQRLKPAVAMVTSRSCPYRCSFCSIIVIGRQWRKASPGKVVADLDALQSAAGERYGHVYFLDANFFVSAPRVVEVARRLQQFQPGLTFSFSTRVNQLIKGQAHLAELRELGLRAVELGIESASQAVLDRLAKDTTVEQNREAIELLRKHGIQLFLDFIMFDAFSSVEDLRKNVVFLEDAQLDSYLPWDHLFNHLTPYVGTAIRREYEARIEAQWDDDRLPAPETLLQDPQVRKVFVEFMKLKPQLGPIAEGLGRLEQEVHPRWTAEAARRTLNAASLRRLPYLLMKRLVAEAARGGTSSFDACLPEFLGPDRRRGTLQEVLDDALQ